MAERAARQAGSAISAGMRVVGSDGQRIGTVARIWRTAPRGLAPQRAATAASTCDAYLMVARIPLFDPLYIPVDQIHQVRQGRIILAVPAEAIERQGWVGRRASRPSEPGPA